MIYKNVDPKGLIASTIVVAILYGTAAEFGTWALVFVVIFMLLVYFFGIPLYELWRDKNRRK